MMRNVSRSSMPIVTYAALRQPRLLSLNETLNSMNRTAKAPGRNIIAINRASLNVKSRLTRTDATSIMATIQKPVVIDTFLSISMENHEFIDDFECKDTK